MDRDGDRKRKKEGRGVGKETRCGLEEGQEELSVTEKEMQWEVICSHKELSAKLHIGSPGSCHALTAAVAF